jgi:hypothetical protein
LKPHAIRLSLAVIKDPERDEPSGVPVQIIIDLVTLTEHGPHMAR